jgi:hypothetical protein
MITLAEIRTVVNVNVPFKTGFMYSNGTRFSEDAVKFSIVFDGNAVPYIPYTEYKWVHKRWKGAINPNEGWIRNKTVNDLCSIINQTSGREKSLIMSAHKRTLQARETLAREHNQMISQGTLQSIKGNKLNR